MCHAQNSKQAPAHIDRTRCYSMGLLVNCVRSFVPAQITISLHAPAADVCIYVRGQVLLNRKYTAYLIRGGHYCSLQRECALQLSPPRLDQVALSLTRGSRQETRSYRVKWSEITFSLNKISTHWELYQRRDLFVNHSRGLCKAGFKNACCRVHFASKCHQFSSFFAYPHENAPDQKGAPLLCALSADWV